MRRLTRLILVLPLLLAACNAPMAMNGNTSTSGEEIEDVARAILTDIQPRSIAQNTEYCGSIVRRADGSLYATKPEAGGADWCGISYIDDLPTYRPGDVLVADYHTHSAYSRFADSEVPSTTDLNSNGQEGIPGYVATPGGRFWYVSPTGRFAYQICEVGCLPSDPNFIDEVGAYRVPERITYQQIANR